MCAGRKEGRKEGAAWPRVDQRRWGKEASLPGRMRVVGEGEVLGTLVDQALCCMPRTIGDTHVVGRGVEGSSSQARPPQQVSYLYWVTAGLAFAEQWNVTTLSSRTGCGSTDRLTSGGSAEGGDSFEAGLLCPWFWGRTGQKGPLRDMEGKGQTV